MVAMLAAVPAAVAAIGWAAMSRSPPAPAKPVVVQPFDNKWRETQSMVRVIPLHQPPPESLVPAQNSTLVRQDEPVPVAEPVPDQTHQEPKIVTRRVVVYRYRYRQRADPAPPGTAVCRGKGWYYVNDGRSWRCRR